MGNETRCFALSFLPPTLSVGITTLFMVPLCMGNHYLNKYLGNIITETDSSFIISRANIIQVCIYVSFGIFMIGLFIPKYVILIKQLTIVFLIYTLFSVACFICNSLYIAFTGSFVFYQKMYYIATREAVDKFPDLDDALTIRGDELSGWQKIEAYMRKKLYLFLAIHFLLLLFMLYYYTLISSFTAEREDKGDDYELQVHKSGQNQKSFSGNSTSNCNTSTNYGNTSTNYGNASTINASLSNNNTVLSTTMDSQAV